MFLYALLLTGMSVVLLGFTMVAFTCVPLDCVHLCVILILMQTLMRTTTVYFVAISVSIIHIGFFCFCTNFYHVQNQRIAAASNSNSVHTARKWQNFPACQKRDEIYKSQSQLLNHSQQSHWICSALGQPSRPLTCVIFQN